MSRDHHTVDELKCVEKPAAPLYQKKNNNQTPKPFPNYIIHTTAKNQVHRTAFENHSRNQENQREHRKGVQHTLKVQDMRPTARWCSRRCR